MDNMKRFVSMLLCVVMLLGFLPVSAFAADATETPVDAALFFSDLHTTKDSYKEDEIKEVMAGVTKSGLDFSSVTSVGDAFSSNNYVNEGRSTTAITQAIRDGLNDATVPVFYAWSDHDRGTDIDNFTGLMYSGENYYIYAISMSDMSSSTRYGQPTTFSNAKLTAFTETVEALDHSKPMFIVSHMPLHDRRDDNQYANEWYGVIRDAAEKMDIVFLWGHNHTDETSVDSAAYYVAKDGTEKMTIQDVGNIVPNFTYLNAGYMSPYSTGFTDSSVRQELVVTAAVYADKIAFVTYDKNGACTGGDAMNETVVREFASKDTGSTEPEVPETTVPAEMESAEDQNGTGITVSASGVTDVTVEVLNPAFNTEAYTAYASFDIKLEGYVQGTEATVNIPTPSSFDRSKPAVVLFEGEQIAEDADLSDGITFTTDHFSVYDVAQVAETAEETLEWVHISTTQGDSYYELAKTMGPGTYLIASAASGNVRLMTNSGGRSSSVNVDDSRITSTSVSAYEWTFEGSNGSYTIKDTNGKYMYPYATYANRTGWSYSLRTGQSSAETVSVTMNSNGLTDISRNVTSGTRSTTSHLRYSSSSFSANTSSQSIYLFKKVTQPGGSVYAAMVADQSVFTFPVGEYNEAAIRNALTVYTADDANGTNQAETTDYTISGTVNPNVAGEYTLAIKYNNVTLGNVTVEIRNYTVVGAHVYPEVGNVVKGAKSDAPVGAVLVLDVQDDQGNDIEVPITVGMLRNPDGTSISTADVGTLENLLIAYNGGYDTDGDGYMEDVNGEELRFTLHVTPKTGNNYPQHPNEGSVKVGKSGTGIDFQSSGLAQIELTTSGIPMSVGVDVIVMLDLSSSMDRCIVHDSKSCTVRDCITRLEALENSLETFQSILQNSPNKDNINVAIADFNGFYSSGPVAYDSRDYIEDEFSDAGNNKIYTGNKAVGAGAFQSAATLNVAGFNLQSGKGTNYDYAFDTIYQLGTAIRDHNAANNQPERELVVLFMSDGAANQFNFYRSEGGSSNEDPNYGWNFWLDGTLYEKNKLGELNCQEHAYYFDQVDHDGDGHYNEHRMANAIKGDPNKEGGYEIIRKSTNGLPAGTMTQVYRDGVKMDNLYTVPGLGATMYAIAFDIAHDGPITDEAIFSSLEQIPTSDEYYVNATSEDDLKGAFQSFANDILFAANNARFVDKMGDDYSLRMKTHTYEVVENGNRVAKTVAPVIEVLEYPIYTKTEADANDDITTEMIGMRKGAPTLKEVVKFSDDGTQAYSNLIDVDKDGKFGVTVNADGTYTITDTDDFIIDAEGIIWAKNFLYNTNTNKNVTVDLVNIPTTIESNGLTSGESHELPAESFYWNLGQVRMTELALRYYVYLDGSMEGWKPAGSYDTNKYATLYYDNYLESPCYKDTVSPAMPWQSAAVYYAFYLVDADGNVITDQTTGSIGGFADRIAITNPVLFDEVYLNSNEQLDVVTVAKVLPSYYTPYDGEASYKVEINSNGTGSWTIHKGQSVATTYVMNYDKSNTAAFSKDLSEDGTGYDYTHTTVWFAVELVTEAHPDTVVIDYGLPVDISVLTNDMFGDHGKLAAVGPYYLEEGGNNAALLEMRGGRDLAAGFGQNYTGTYGKAEAHTGSGEVRYELDAMKMDGYEQFMYAVNYTGAENAGYYYDTVTVIPATTIYFEDSFIDTSSYTWSYDVNDWVINTESSVWNDPDAPTGVQDEDRPGSFALTDANNIYGYDKVNLSMSTHSMNNALKATVDYDNYGVANFTFYGTGFDMISMTSAETGTILVDVYSVNPDGSRGAKVKGLAVDTYYGYTKADCHVVYTYKDPNPMVDSNNDNDATNDYEWVLTDTLHKAENCNGCNVAGVTLPGVAEPMQEIHAVANTWIEDTSNSECLWQVPVIEVENLTYGAYEVEVTAMYNPGLDHKEGSVSGSYEFYLDAIRVYDPANDGAADGTVDTTIEDAYKADHEAWPSYIELRNKLLDANELGNDDTTTKIEGMVFIDGDANVGQQKIADYVNFGPNNEVYLNPGQSVAFMLSDVKVKDAKGNDVSIVDKVHIGIKSANGEIGTYAITNVANADRGSIKAGEYYGKSTAKMNTTTDMYYDLTAWKDDIIVISNTGNEKENNTNGIISLTNIKVTYTQNPNAAAVANEEDNADNGIATASAEEELAAPTNEVYTFMTSRAATMTLRAMNAPAEQEPEDTEPTEPSEPEDTEPTEPEVVEPDYSELQAAVKAAKALKEKDYTKQSFDAMKRKLQAAELTLMNQKANQEQIDEILAELNAAVDALQLKPGKPEKPEKPGKPEKPEKPNKPKAKG